MGISILLGNIHRAEKQDGSSQNNSWKEINFQFNYNSENYDYKIEEKCTLLNKITHLNYLSLRI